MAEEILNRYPAVDGIISCNDMVAISVFKVLRRHGYQIPEDVQIIGFDTGGRVTRVNKFPVTLIKRETTIIK